MSGEGDKGPQSAPPSGSRVRSPTSIKALSRGIIGRYSDFITDITAPDLFKLWTAISAIGSAGERRVFTRMRQGDTFPNQYALLVGEAGTGKSAAMSPMQGIIIDASPFILAGNDVTKQGFLDQLGSDEGRRWCGLDDFHYLGLWVSEISNFMPVFDPVLAGVLTDLWDCPRFNQEVKRHMKKGQGQVINYPACSLLMGCATGSLGNVFTSEVWKTGFMARMIIIHSNERAIPQRLDDVWAKSDMDAILRDELVQRFKQLGKLEGQMEWTAEAQKEYFWFKKSPTPPPDHDRLDLYNRRRDRHIIKLAMVMALNEGRMTVTEEDFDDALGVLHLTEMEMPHVFFNMTSHQDHDRLIELANQVRLARKEVPKPVLLRMMSNTFPLQHLNVALKMAEEGGFIRRVAGTQGENALYTAGDRKEA